MSADGSVLGSSGIGLRRDDAIGAGGTIPPPRGSVAPKLAPPAAVVVPRPARSGHQRGNQK